MGIINGYDDIDMIITDLSEKDIRRLVSGRKFAIIRISEELITNYQRKRIGQKFYPKYLLGINLDDYVLQIDDGKDTTSRIYLCIKKKLPKYRHVDGVSISYPSIEELITMISGKRLIFCVAFAEDYCCVEEEINERLQGDVFNLRIRSENYLYDEFFCVQVFLQEVTDADTGIDTLMKPTDIRNYDINSKILSKLKDECNQFYDDALTIQYELVSERLQAQYFLSKFHSNRKWDLDPVCILNFKLASFVLPRTISAQEVVDIPADRIVCDIKSGTRYVIDSIHMNSDICSNLSELNSLIERFMYNIGLA